MTGFDLNNFQKNEDGSYSKKKTVPQPRDLKNPLKTTDLPKYPMHKLTGTVNCNFIDAPVQGWFMVDPSQKRKITLTLFGEPMPKQSVRSFGTGKTKVSKTGKTIHVVGHFQPTAMGGRVKDYQAQIKKQLPEGFTMFMEMVHVTKMHFLFSPLKEFHKTKGKMDAIRNGEIFYKTTKPDLPDNLKKLVNDSMSGLVFKDDSIIVSEDNVKKYYGIGGCIIIELEGY